MVQRGTRSLLFWWSLYHTVTRRIGVPSLGLLVLLIKESRNWGLNNFMSLKKKKKPKRMWRAFEFERGLSSHLRWA